MIRYGKVSKRATRDSMARNVAPRPTFQTGPFAPTRRSMAAETRAGVSLAW